MKLNVIILKKYSWVFQDKKYYKLSLVGEGLSHDILTSEQVYNIAELNTEYLATFMLKTLKDDRGKDILCVHKVGYLKAV